jgi:integrase
LKCPDCGDTRVFRDGFRPAPLYAVSNEPVQRYRCASYGHRFDDISKNPENRFHRSAKNLEILNIDSDNNRNSQISAKGAKNLVSTQEIKTCAETDKSPTENAIKAVPQLEKLLSQLKSDGRKPHTIKNYELMLGLLIRKGADLFDPENTKAVLAELPMKNSSKKTVANMLDVWFNFNGIRWRMPKYCVESQTPYIPTEAELDQFIACLGKRTSTFCQMLKDTGARYGELERLKWTDIDFGRRQVRIRAEKGSNSRTLPLSTKAIDMLCNLRRDREKVFCGLRGLQSTFYQQRKRKAQQLANPNFLLIHFHTFRHWKATTEQHKTKDPWHVKMILGHKSIQSTETYIHLEEMLYQETNDQFTVKVADTLEDAVKLMEVGFEFHAEIEGHKLFRKRK